MTTGQRIKEARKRAGMTQSELAQKLNIPFQSVSQWERDLRNPKIETLLRISAALKVDVNWLMNGQTLEQRDQAMKDHVARRFSELKERTSDKWKKESEEIEAMLSELEAEKDAPSELKILQAYHKLNLDGQYEAVKRVEELTEIPKYRRTTTSQSTQAPPEGKDTAKPTDAPETPPEGK